MEKTLVVNILLGVIFVFLLGQFILSSFSVISNVSLLCIVFLNYKVLDSRRKISIIFVFWMLMLLVGYSIIMQNDISLIFRFFLVLFFLIYAYYIRVDYINPNFFKVIFGISMPICIFLIIFEILLLVYFDDATVKFIRSQALESRIGDIYYSGFYYKIQLKGFAILPFIYMLSYIADVFPRSSRILLRLIYLLAILIAGNFAYILAILFFHCIFYFANITERKYFFQKICLFFFIAICVASFFIPYALDVMEEKKDVSSAIRLEQASLLMKDMCETPCTFLLGQGLGNTLNAVTSFRDYRENIYFELQVLYFLNQLGIFLFFLFLIFNVILAYKLMPSVEVRIVYVSYILYAITNPYILDTTQVFVIIMLLLAQRQILNKSLLDGKNNMCVSHI